MKRLFKLISILGFVLFFIGCSSETSSSQEGFSKTGKAGDLTVTYSSSKPLVVGNNKIDIKITKNGKPIKGAKVEMKIYMPEMPGMPYMEEKENMQEISNLYSGNINFSMGGTWQVKIFIEKDGKKYKYTSSVII